MIRKFKHKKTGIIGENNTESEYFLHFKRGDGEVAALEAISMEFIEDSNDWVEVFDTEEVCKKRDMSNTYTFKIEEKNEVFLGEVEEVQGVVSFGYSEYEVLRKLVHGLKEMKEYNKIINK